MWVKRKVVYEAGGKKRWNMVDIWRYIIEEVRTLLYTSGEDGIDWLPNSIDHRISQNKIQRTHISISNSEMKKNQFIDIVPVITEEDLSWQWSWNTLFQPNYVLALSMFMSSYTRINEFSISSRL